MQESTKHKALESSAIAEEGSTLHRDCKSTQAMPWEVSPSGDHIIPSAEVFLSQLEGCRLCRSSVAEGTCETPCKDHSLLCTACKKSPGLDVL